MLEAVDTVELFAINTCTCAHFEGPVYTSMT